MNKLAIYDDAVARLSEAIIYGGHSLDSIPVNVKQILGKNVYGEAMWPRRLCEALSIEVMFDSFEAFVKASLPRGLGTTIRTLEHLCQDDPEALSMITEAIRKPHGGDRVSSKVDNINVAKRPTGTSKTHALRSLLDHRPDLHERVLAKELSPHAAMIEAGFRRRTFTVPDDIEAAADTLMRQFGDRKLESLWIAIGKRLKSNAA